MGTDWIYHNIWRYFPLIDLIEKSIKLHTWLTVGSPSILTKPSCRLLQLYTLFRGKFSQFDARYRNKTKQYKTKKTVFFTANSGYHLDECQEISSTKLCCVCYQLDREADQSWSVLAANLSLQLCFWISEFLIFMMLSWVWLLLVKHSLCTKGTQLPTGF